MKKHNEPATAEILPAPVVTTKAKEIRGAILPVIDGMNLDSPQKENLSSALMRFGYDDPHKTAAILGPLMFVILNSIYVNITGGIVGGDNGFPLVEAYQNAQKLEASKKVLGKESEGTAK